MTPSPFRALLVAALALFLMAHSESKGCGAPADDHPAATDGGASDAGQN